MDGTEETRSLEESYKRFLERVVASARSAGVIDNAGLFTQYPHKRLFEAYKDEPKSRAALLAANSKMPFEIAEHLDVAGCIQVFDIALDKLKEATPDKVFEKVTPAELVRMTDNKELWEYVEGKKWYLTESSEHRQLARELLAACKEFQLGGGPTRTLHAIEDSIGIDAYVEHLPKAALAAIIRAARELGDGKLAGKPIPFTVDAMAEAAGTDVLADHLPLPVLVRPIHAFAKAAGWIVEASEPEAAKEPAPADGKDQEAIEKLVNPPTEPPPSPGATPPPLPPKAEGAEVREDEVEELDELSPEDAAALAALEEGKKGEELVLEDFGEDETGDGDKTQVKGNPLVPPPKGKRSASARK